MEEPAAEKPPALKPLEELTDADIMQLTREDCRRYLKQRGMRRPSWNKAEAIQQVLLLKGLFGSCKREKDSSNHAASAEQQTKQFLEKCKSVVPSAAPRFPQPQQPSQLEAAAKPQHQSSSEVLPARPEAPAAKPHTAQLTIFYSGVVNVFDDVPLEKAQAVMLLAGSKGQEFMQLVNQREGVAEPAGVVQQQEDSTESCMAAQARAASLLKFLAKRRERRAGPCS